MQVVIDSLLEGATRAAGVVAVIDVFRAFERSVEEALGLRQSGLGQFCIGEVDGSAPDGFDFGNSPFEIASVDFQGKTVIQRTSAGTQGIVLASSRAERLYAASLY
jgi:2-phosphosulfolactate phosphatase